MAEAISIAPKIISTLTFCPAESASIFIHKQKHTSKTVKQTGLTTSQMKSSESMSRFTSSTLTEEKIPAEIIRKTIKYFIPSPSCVVAFVLGFLRAFNCLRKVCFDSSSDRHYQGNDLFYCNLN